MAIPTYAPILDSEIEPGDTALANIFVRLRDNPLAVMGVDTTDPSPNVDPPRQVEFVASTPFEQHSWSNQTTPASLVGSWMDLCDEDDIGSLGVVVLRGSTARALTLETSTDQHSFRLYDGSGGAPPWATTINHSVLVSPVFTSGVFSGVQLSLETLSAPIQYNFSSGVGVVFSGALAAGDCIVAPSAVTILLKIAIGARYVSLSIEHRVVGTMHQVRFLSDTAPSASIYADTLFEWNSVRYNTALKG